MAVGDDEFRWVAAEWMPWGGMWIGTTPPDPVVTVIDPPDVQPNVPGQNVTMTMSDLCHLAGLVVYSDSVQALLPVISMDTAAGTVTVGPFPDWAVSDTGMGPEVPVDVWGPMGLDRATVWLPFAGPPAPADVLIRWVPDQANWRFPGTIEEWTGDLNQREIRVQWDPALPGPTTDPVIAVNGAAVASGQGYAVYTGFPPGTTYPTSAEMNDWVLNQTHLSAYYDPGTDAWRIFVIS
jgi:hypothetical protein